MNAWLGVASADHVRRAVALGIAQLGHGKRAGLSRMHVGDTLIFYSPVERFGDGIPLQHFTAIGEIADDEIWQADESGFRPFRRRVRYADTAPVDLRYRQGEMLPGDWASHYLIKSADRGALITWRITGSMAGYEAKTVFTDPVGPIVAVVNAAPRPRPCNTGRVPASVPDTSWGPSCLRESAG